MGAAEFLIPAVSLRGDQVVIVKENAYEPVEDERGDPFGLTDFIEIFLKPYPAILVVDIDGLEQGAAQFDALGDLRSGGPEVWWDAAVRDHTDVINILTAGADRAVVSTRNLRNMSELAQAVEVSENVVFEIVTRGRDLVAQRRLAQAGGPGPLAAQAAQAGVESFLVLDASRPLGAPIAWDVVAQAGAQAKSLYVGGGVAAAQVKSMTPPPALELEGWVVDLISVLTPYM